MNLRFFRTFSLAVLLSLILGCTNTSEPVRIVNSKYKPVINDIRYEALFYMSRSTMPGSTLAVSIKGETVYAEAFGLANTDLNVPASRNTKYRIGEISQAITALTYFTMVERGLLSPQDTIQSYLPDYPYINFPIQLQHLVDQTSGIRVPTLLERHYRGNALSLQNGLHLFSNDSLLFAPGQYQYPTSFSYNLLGAVIEKRAEKSFQRVVSEMVLDTLKMLSTQPDNPFATIINRSAFFDRDMIAQMVHANTLDLRFRLPSEGYLSTAEDLLKLGNALLYGNGISETVRNQMLTAPKINGESMLPAGNGLMFLQNSRGEFYYASRGLVTGGGAMLIILPKEEIVVAWSANINDEFDELPGLMVANSFRDFLEGNYKTRKEKMQEAEKELSKQNLQEFPQ